MRTKKIEAKKNEKKIEANLYENEKSISSLKTYAGKSGIALKKTTIERAGDYPIIVNNTGSSILFRSILKTFFPNKNKVSADIFGAKLSELFSGKYPKEDREIEAKIRSYEKENNKEFKNYGTLKNRILSEIRAGRIISFSGPYNKIGKTLSLVNE